MNWRNWGKRLAAFTMAIVCVAYAWHVYKNDYSGESDSVKEARRLEAQQRKSAVKLSSPSTRPLTKPAKKPMVARAEPAEPASTEPLEREGRDLYHPPDRGNPFRMARATRHIDGPTDTVRAIALSKDKTKLVAGGNDRIVRLFDFASGKELRHFEGHTRFILGVDISEDGSRIISCGEDHTVRVWDANSGEQIALLEDHQDEVIAVHFLSDPNLAVSASSDGTARIWDIDNETTVKKIDYGRRVCSMAVCLPQNLLVLGTHAGDVYLWDLKTRTEIRQFDRVPDCIHSLVISTDGKRVAIFPAMKPFRIVDVATGKTVFVEDENEWERTWSAALSADGQTLALGRGFQLIFYNLQTFTRCKTYLNPNAFTQSLCFVPDGPIFVSAGGGMLTKDDHWMRPWDDTILIWTLPKPLP